MINVTLPLKSFASVVALLLLTGGCAAQRPFVWVEELPDDALAEAGYRISPGDELMISVWGQDQITGTQRVRKDGNISIVLIGDIPVAGLTTAEAAKLITGKLEGDIVQNVRVDVGVVTTTPSFITVIGEVATQSKIELAPDDNLVDVIAKSGGFTEFAKTDQIYVLRMDKQMQLIRFDFDRVTSCPNAGIQFKLRDGDIVIVD